jgi:DNA gyrase/topoisomerase IV subunit A
MGVLIFTKHGDYVYLKDYKEISDLSRNASGIQVLQPKIDDECVGFQLIMPQYQKHAIVVTRKGCMKRIELEYLGESKRRKDSSYIATIKEGDEIFDVIAYDDTYEDTAILLASTRSGDKEIKVNTIPVLGRKAKPNKIPGFDNIDLVTIKQE